MENVGMKSASADRVHGGPVIQLPLLLVALVAQNPGGYVPLLQLDGTPGWSTDSQQCVEQTGQTLSIDACAGWVRFRTQLAQTYRLAFELRGRDATATAMLSLSTLSTTDGTAQPTAVVPLKPTTDWAEYVVDVDRTVTVEINGTRTPFGSLNAAPVGTIALKAQGNIEVRNPRFMYRPPALTTSTTTVPRVIHQVQPNYTKEARDKKIQGTVVVGCVVLPDGSVGTVTVLRSLDAAFGLDEEAIKAVKQWRFEPGTLDGKPVPVRVTIMVPFTVK